MASFTASPLAGDENHHPSSGSSGAVMLFGKWVTPSTETLSGSHDSVVANETTPAEPQVPPLVPELEEYVAVDGPDHDQWMFKKTLEQSDVDSSSRLLLGRKPVIVDHIGQFDTERGVALGVYDVDMGTTHTLVLKKWKTNSYILNKGWTKDFVKRRGLRRSDEIGIRWEENERRLEFTVIKWAPRRMIMSFIN